MTTPATERDARNGPVPEAVAKLKVVGCRPYVPMPRSQCMQEKCRGAPVPDQLVFELNGIATSLKAIVLASDARAGGRARKAIQRLLSTSVSSIAFVRLERQLSASATVGRPSDRATPLAFPTARQVAWRTRKRSDPCGSRSTTWIGSHAHCQTLMPGSRENWICPRVPSRPTLGQAPATRPRRAP